tara:strand:+ start:353 stop:1306 length:954 start_codon:yes stop_codon:yes gene_type:complete
MALSDFQVFNDFAYNSFVTTFQQNAELFNAASNNAIQLRVNGFSGDYKSKSQFENLASLVGNRDASSTSAASEHALAELLQVEVKVGMGTPNISYTNTSFDYTQRDPAQAGTLFGEAIAEGAMAYQLNSALAALVASVAAADVTYDGTAAIASLESLNAGAGKFGDRRQAIGAWVMHSKSITDIYAGALANSNRLFTFGTIQVMDDGFGRPLIMTDSDALHFDNAGTENYHQLGLVAGAIAIEDQGDMRVYNDIDLSEENAKQLLKVESTFGVGVKGYTWNTAVVKPNDAALALAGNWSRVASLGLKDTCGVKVTTL